MENDMKKEQLALKLKHNCQENGKEINLKDSAQIFHEFGLLYRSQSPDKISLIRSGVFFNAALVRQPLNELVLNSLKELCTHVLYIAGAHHADANLIDISKLVKKEVENMRSNAKISLEKFSLIPLGLKRHQIDNSKTEKIRAISQLQEKITGDYINVMRFTSKECIKIMGSPPCSYAIAGMGSLARKEITPYSDFEHVILLEESVQFSSNYENILDYFRWFTVIFQLIIINLQETIIPSVAVPELNNPCISGGDWFFDDFTTRGISFDGMMLHACKFPLGRTEQSKDKPWTTELIKPISEMVKYLQPEEDLNNDYRLADVLAKSCFVAGSENVYDAFESHVKNCFTSTNLSQVKSVLKDLVNYDTADAFEKINNEAKYNIKHLVYRNTTLFISALGQFHAIDKNCCFEITTELLKKRIIDEETSQALLYAVAIACETRLRVYFSNKSQNDYLEHRSFYASEDKVLKPLCDMLGEQCLGDYFIIAHCFQTSIRILGDKLQIPIFCERTSLNTFRILFSLKFYRSVIVEWKAYRRQEDQFADTVIRYLVAVSFAKTQDFVQALEMLTDIEGEVPSWNFPWLSKYDIWRRKAHCLCELGDDSVALRYIELRLEPILDSRTTDMHAPGYLMALRGDCQRRLQAFSDAIESYQAACCLLNESKRVFKKNLVIKCCYYSGQCYLNMKEFEKALKICRKGFDICHASTVEISLECDCCRLLGRCCLGLSQTREAIGYFKQELVLRKKPGSPVDASNANEISILQALIREASKSTA